MINNEIDKGLIQFFLTGRFPEDDIRHKIIYDYFDLPCSEGVNSIPDNMPYAELWSEFFPESTIDHFLKKVKPLKLWLLDKDSLDSKRLNFYVDINKEKLVEYTKGELKSFVLNGGKFEHTNLRMFDDQLIILAKTEDEDGLMDSYMFFRLEPYALSGGQIGRFRTFDSVEQVVQSIVNTMDQEILERANDADGLKGYTELPVSFISGDISFLRG